MCVAPFLERPPFLAIAEHLAVAEALVHRNPPAVEWTGSQLDSRSIAIANRPLAIDEPDVLPRWRETLEGTVAFVPCEGRR
jgi:hypothetical protein